MYVLVGVFKPLGSFVGLEALGDFATELMKIKINTSKCGGIVCYLDALRLSKSWLGNSVNRKKICERSSPFLLLIVKNMKDVQTRLPYFPIQ